MLIGNRRNTRINNILKGDIATRHVRSQNDPHSGNLVAFPICLLNKDCWEPYQGSKIELATWFEFVN